MANTGMISPQVDDEFDLDVQISVLERHYHSQLGPTIWLSCMGGTCSCSTTEPICGTMTSIAACC